ncbi:MAG: hypothetical protein VB962_01085 [Pseudohongiellaceae bacterium]|jgi:hypothetical protein
MTNSHAVINGRIRKLKFLLIAALLSWVSLADAQNVTPFSQTGVVEALLELEGDFLTISGRRYGFDFGLSKVFLGGEEVGVAALDVGLVVRFSLNSESTLVMIEILGPFEKIKLLLLKQS